MVKENPTAIQSKQMLQEALIHLLSKSTYDSITVTDLAKEADLSRRTFYRHYQTKEDVLSDIFQVYYQDYLEALKGNNSIELPDITEVFFSFWAERVEFLQLLSKSSLTYLFLDKMNQFITEIYHELKGHLHEYEDKETLKYALSFSVGGHFNVLMLWMNEGAEKKPSEMKRIIQTALKVSTSSYP